MPIISTSQKAFHTLFEHVSLFRFLEKENDFVETVTAAVKRLDSRQRQLITERYLEHSDRDFVVTNTMQISQSTYTKIRNNAFFKLGLVLNVPKMNEDAEKRIAKLYKGAHE